MKPLVFVPVFPGTNCERETVQWLTRNLDVETTHTSEGCVPERLAAVVVPGGFTFGDYLRAGALAARSPALDLVRGAREHRVPILGICNGFQILCEARVLPGALMRNACKHHLHGPVQLELNEQAADHARSCWLPNLKPGALTRCFQLARLPISCGMGAYVLPKAMRALGGIEEQGDRDQGRQTAPARAPLAHHCAEHGFVPLLHYTNNLPGSSHAIAAISSADGRVLGMMPHPERASDLVLGDDSGLVFLYGLAQSQNLKVRAGSPLAAFVRRLSGEEAP